VPRISFFRGITIAMFWREGAHQTPHFHAEHAGQVASVAISAELLAGSLSRRDLALVREWAALHVDQLLDNWDRVRRYEPLLPIDPLS
jgi:hypothetical protein